MSEAKRTRYTRQSIVAHNFYQLQKFLFEDEFADLSDTAKVLYSIIRNRHEISIKNGWYDENGEVYLYFKREEMQSIMKRSDKAITRAMNELKEINLLEEIRQGVGKPNKIYLLSAMVDTLGIEAAETIENSMTRTMYESGHGDSTSQDTENVRVNNNQNEEIQNKENHNNSDTTSSPVLSSQSEKEDGTDTADDTAQRIEAYHELIKENISYDDLAVVKPHDINLVDEFIAIIIDTVMTKGKTVWIGGEDKPRALVTGNLLKLNYEDIDHAIDQFKAYTKPITKKKQFILTTLYNCKLELDSHYTNRVSSDRWNNRAVGATPLL